MFCNTTVISDITTMQPEELFTIW